MERFYLLLLGFLGTIFILKATIYWEKEEEKKAAIFYVWGISFLIYTFFNILLSPIFK